MFITQKRLEREKQELIASTKMLNEAILTHVSQGLLFLDAKGKILPQVSQSLTTLFRRRDFNNLTFEKLLIPHVTPKVLSRARSYLALLREASAAPDTAPNPLSNVEVRLKNSDGSFETAHFSFEFSPLDTAPGMWMVRVTDITARVQQSREVEDLRVQLNTHAEILRSILRMGRVRFAAALHKIAAAMKSINEILKKPAREEEAFRRKLEETLDEVDRIRRAGKALKLSAVESAAHDFENALHELGGRRTLSGSDFLPLAVKLDELFSQFAAVRTLITSPRQQRSEREPRIERRRSRSPGILIVTETTTDSLGDVGARLATNTLEQALTQLAADMAAECHKSVNLECKDLHFVPAEYESTVMQVAAQLIRNAVIHGIELPEERRAGGKPLHGTLRLTFSALDTGGYELSFQDDGRGLDADQVRRTAVAKGLIDEESVDRLRDRQAIKLIFKAGYTTAPEPSDSPSGDTGLAFVRRLIHKAGGKIALASLPGHEVRFKVMLPPVAVAATGTGADEAKVA